MKLLAGLSLLISIVTGTVAGNAPAGPGGDKLFLMDDTDRNQWCAYDKESRWRSEVEAAHARVVASVEYLDHQIKVINLTEEDEAGDWTAYDNYELDNKAEIRRIKRTINVLPGDVSKEEIYVMSNGSLRKQGSVSRSLNNGKEISSPNVWFPNLPLAKRVRDFPFAPLVGTQHPEVWSRDKVCIGAVK